MGNCENSAYYERQKNNQKQQKEQKEQKQNVQAPNNANPKENPVNQDIVLPTPISPQRRP